MVRESQGKVSVKYFFGKVMENENLVPPDVRFSGYNASNSISAGGLRPRLHWVSLQCSPDPLAALSKHIAP